MLIQQDFDLNSVHACNGPLKEALRKTMVNQELIFRTQVHELHRLHSTQKMLMQNFSRNKSEEHNLGKACTKLSMLPPRTTLTRYGPLAKEAGRSLVSSMLANEVDLHGTKQKFFEGCRDVFYKFQHRPSVQYIDHVVEDLKLPDNQYIFHADAEQLTLSLCFGEDNRRKGIAKRTSFELKACVFSQNVIDLEESTEQLSNEDSEHAASSKSVALTMSIDSSGKLESHDSVIVAPIISSSVKKDPLQGTVKGKSFLHDNRRGFFNLDSSSTHLDVLNGNFSDKEQPISLPVKWNLDLNKDDSFCYSDGPMMTHPSTESSSVASFNGLVGRQDDASPCSIFHAKEYSKCSKESSDMLHQDGARKFLFIDLNSNCEKMELSQFNKLSDNEVDPVFEDVSKPKIGHYEVSGEEKIDSGRNYGSSLEFSKSNIHKCVATRVMNNEKGKLEDIEVSNSNPCQITSKDGHGDISSVSGKIRHCVDNDSSNEDAAISEVELGNPTISDELSETRIGFEVPVPEMVSDEQNQRSFCRIEVKHQCFKKEDPDEVDVLIEEAAESLLRISLDNSACYQTCSTKDEGSQEFETKEKESPEISDFFELMTLLTENSADDLSFPSKPHEVNFSEKKDCGVNIRRGRRLKNFQKDILPGLASLSMHEIREDINIMEGVLRSREYKKMRAELADGQSWCTPRKSRRSQVNHTGRRRFLGQFI